MVLPAAPRLVRARSASQRSVCCVLAGLMMDPAQLQRESDEYDGQPQQCGEDDGLGPRAQHALTATCLRIARVIVAQKRVGNVPSPSSRLHALGTACATFGMCAKPRRVTCRNVRLCNRPSGRQDGALAREAADLDLGQQGRFRAFEHALAPRPVLPVGAWGRWVSRTLTLRLPGPAEEGSRKQQASGLHASHKRVSKCSDL